MNNEGGLGDEGDFGCKNVRFLEVLLKHNIYLLKNKHHAPEVFSWGQLKDLCERVVSAAN